MFEAAWWRQWAADERNGRRRSAAFYNVNDNYVRAVSLHSRLLKFAGFDR